MLSVVVCTERFVAMRTLFLVDLALLALVLGELVTSQSTATRKIFLTLIAFVSLLFMNTLNVLSQIGLPRKLFLTTRTNKSHLLLLLLCLRTRAATWFVFVLVVLLMKNNKQNKKKTNCAINFLIMFLFARDDQEKIIFDIRFVSIQFILFLLLFLFLLLVLVLVVHEANYCTIQDAAIDSRQYLAEFFLQSESTPYYAV